MAHSLLNKIEREQLLVQRSGLPSGEFSLISPGTKKSGQLIGARRRPIVRYDWWSLSYKAFVHIARFVLNLRTLWNLILRNVCNND